MKHDWTRPAFVPLTMCLQWGHSIIDKLLAGSVLTTSIFTVITETYYVKDYSSIWQIILSTKPILKILLSLWATMLQDHSSTEKPARYVLRTSLCDTKQTYLWMCTLDVSIVCPPVMEDLRNPCCGFSNISNGYQNLTSTPSLRR